MEPFCRRRFAFRSLSFATNGPSLARFKPGTSKATSASPHQGESILRIKTLFMAAAAMTVPAVVGAQTPAQDHSQHQTPAASTPATTAPATSTPATSTPAATTPAAGATATNTASADAAATVGPVQAATKEDIKTGANVIDQKGGSVGTIESVTADGAVIATGKARVQIPLGSFGKSASGLVIGMTKTELEAAAAKGG
jgi:hypothetical protein